MTSRSAGILPFRRRAGMLEVLLGHPGGPFWRSRDEGSWSIIKGEHGEDEEPEAAARREFFEETGWPASGPLNPLGDLRQRGGKRVAAYALESDFDPATLTSNVFEIEWPPRSGLLRSFPEIDRCAWFGIDKARSKILSSQEEFLDRLQDSLKF